MKNIQIIPMKNNATKTVFAGAVALALLFSGACQAPASTLKQSESFTDKNWQMKGLTIAPEIDWNLDGIPDTDIFPLLDACEQDDGFLFQRDNQVIRVFGDELCDEESSDEAGRWSYSDTDRKLTIIEGEDDIQEFKVLESSANRLILLYRFQSTDEQWHDMTAVYTLRP